MFKAIRIFVLFLLLVTAAISTPSAVASDYRILFDEALEGICLADAETGIIGKDFVL